MSTLETKATRNLDARGVAYTVVPYGRVANAEEAAVARGIELRQLVKTLVLRQGGGHLFVLVGGNTAINWKRLRKQLGVRKANMPDAVEAKQVTGYERGTITPFGSTRHLPVVVDSRIMENDMISLGSGVHGVAINLAPTDLVATLSATVADIADVTTDA